jgi:MoaA/NifB/PqqE/SkfB family radical SAM enzyme
MTARQRLDVHLYVTPRCNLTCPHCYYDAYDRRRHPDNLMSLEEISALLRELCRRFQADISLEGGEPFLRVGLDRMLAALSTEVLRSLTVTTNGTVKVRTDPRILRDLGQLRVSIDGHVDELQKELRSVELAPVLKSCRQLRQQDVPFWVRMTLWKRNIRELAEIFAWVEQEKIEQLSLFEYQSSGRGIGQELRYGVSDSDVATFLDDMIMIPPPSCLRVLTVNFAERRVEAVIARQQLLEGAAFTLRQLPVTPNCTINYDGTVGVSPWRVTADGAADIFTTTAAPDFYEVIKEAASSGALRDDSGCISRIQIVRW